MNHDNDVAIKAMCDRKNSSGKSFQVDVLFPQILSGKADMMSVDEGTAALLSGLVSAIKPAKVLETGTHKGRSTKAISDALLEHRGLLYTVDMRDYGLMADGAISDEAGPYLTQIVGKTPDVYCDEPLFSLRGIELAFLDGAHDCEGLKADIEYVDAHRDGPCVVVVDKADDPGWPEIKTFFQTYNDYPHVFIPTMCGIEIVKMG